MVKQGDKNPNWKGGVSDFRRADDLLTMSTRAVSIVRAKFLARFEVDHKSGCWLWTGSVFKMNGRARLENVLASRIAFVLFKGPTNGLCVLHTCDNVKCVNPHHLFLGTNADNSRDMVNKGRAATGDRNGSRLYPERLVRGDNHLNRKYPERVQGARNGRALLTEEQVREIRRRYRPYINNHKPSNTRELAQEFGVAFHVISAIGKGLTWRHVK